MWRESRLLLWSPLVIQHLKCHVRNASLLQNDRDVDTRNTNLQNARTKYQLEQKTFNLLEDQRVQVNLVVGKYLRNYVISILSEDFQIYPGLFT